MISQTFLLVNNIACAIYRKVSLNILVRYYRIEYTTSGMIYTETNIFLFTDKVFILIATIFTHDTLVV